MRYTEHLSEKTESSWPPSWWRRFDLRHVNQVTKLSKVLSLMLFVFLPFGGFWLGQQYAPVVYVSVTPHESAEVAAATSTPEVEEERQNRVVIDQTTDTSAWSDYADPETGISFSYPADWGNVQHSDEPGECPRSYTEDPCLMRLYSLHDTDSERSAVFLVAATAGHATHPMARGAFWGDRVHSRVADDLVESCKEAVACTELESSTGLSMMRYEEEGNISLTTGASDTTTRYYTALPDRAFDRFVFSAEELGWVSGQEQQFEASIVNTFTVE